MYNIFHSECTDFNCCLSLSIKINIPVLLLHRLHDLRIFKSWSIKIFHSSFMMEKVLVKSVWYNLPINSATFLIPVSKDHAAPQQRYSWLSSFSIFNILEHYMFVIGPHFPLSCMFFPYHVNCCFSALSSV